MWRKVASPTTSDLYKVFALSEHHVWITVREENKIFRLNDDKWEEWAVNDTGLGGIRGIYALSPSDVWLVGTESWGNSIAHWNGKKWQRYKDSNSKPLQAIQMLSNQLGWAVGFDGLILKWDGSAWHKVTSPTKNILNDIHMLSPTEGWIVGHNGTILQYNRINHEWQQVEVRGYRKSPGIFEEKIFEPEETQDLLAIKMLNSRLGWCAGINSTLTIYDGNKWTSIFGPNAEPVYPAPNDKLLRWFDPEWNKSLNGSSIFTHINSLAIIGDKLWAACGNWGDKDNGYIFLYDQLWYKQSEFSLKSIYSIHMLSEKSGWAVGKDGLILRWQA